MARPEKLFPDDVLTRDETYRLVGEAEARLRNGGGSAAPARRGAAPSRNQPAPSALSGELAQGLGELGITPTLSGGYVDPEDPQVWDGKAFVPASSLTNRFYVLPKADLERFQQAAVKAGLIRKDNLRLGAYDDETFQVWRSAVNQSAGFAFNGIKKDPFSALDGIAALTPAEVDEEQAAPLSASVSDPESIKAGLKKAARSVLGVGVDEATLDRLAAEFQSLQQGAQFSQQAAARNGGTSVAAPEFATFAEAKIREVDPLKADARKKLDVVDTIHRLMTADPTQQSGITTPEAMAG